MNNAGQYASGLQAVKSNWTTPEGPFILRGHSLLTINVESDTGVAMMNRWQYLLLPVFAGMLAASPARAHHAFSAEYDINQVIEVTGVVTKVEWTNPHVRFYIDIEGENGEMTNWDFELQSVNTLTRAGWSRTALQEGDIVTVIGYKARNGSNRANARGSVTKADGTLLFAGDPTSQ